MNKTWEVVLVVLTLVAVGLGTSFIVHDHAPVGYYLEMAGTRTGAPFCVEESVPWGADMDSFCSGDINKVLEVLQASNASVKH